MRELERDLPTDTADAEGAPPFSRLAVIGPGRAGSSIAAAADAAGLTVRLAGRPDASEACRTSEVALLCVPDGEIVQACADAATAVPPLRFVGHVSGATGLDALAAASEAGAQVFSLHPLQTIPDARTDLVGAPCAVAGSEPAPPALAREPRPRPGRSRGSSRSGFRCPRSGCPRRRATPTTPRPPWRPTSSWPSRS